MITDADYQAARFERAKAQADQAKVDLDAARAKLAFVRAGGTLSQWKSRQRRAQREAAQQESPAATDRAEAVPPRFEVLCQCPAGHWGFHLLNRCEDDAGLVLRTCSYEDCEQMWRQAL